MCYGIDLRKLNRYLRRLIALLAVCAAACLAFSWYYPLKHIALIELYCRKYDLDPALVCAVIHTESRFDEAARSYKGASGLMQIVQPTADWASDEIGLANYGYDKILDPAINIEIGCWLLNRLRAQFGAMDQALAAYNAGSGNVAKWLSDQSYSKDGATLDVIPFKETARYVEKVRFNRTVYSYILQFYGRGSDYEED